MDVMAGLNARSRFRSLAASRVADSRRMPVVRGMFA